MAKVLAGIALPDAGHRREEAAQAIWVLQMAIGVVVLLGTVIFFLGTTWDIQWHSVIGRDRTLIPPHIMMLCGVTMSGLAALGSVLIDTLRVKRGSLQAQESIHFADAFHGPLGAYVAGFGALASAIAFPLDSYWHALYGIDVAIWAPFHIMIIGGMGIAALGAACILIGAAHKAAGAGSRKANMWGYIGMLVACATMIDIMVLLTVDAISSSYFIVLPGMTLTVFPFMLGILGAWTLVAVSYAVPFRWVATITCGFSFLFLLIAAAAIPSAMSFLMAMEHIVFRANIGSGIDPHLPIVPLQWLGLSLLLSAILLDVFVPIIRRKNWSRKKQSIILAFVALPGCIPMAPIALLLSLQLWHDMGIGFLVSLFVGGLAGTLLGAQTGRGMGESMQRLER